jgi:signal transduction histidine kinase
MPKTEQPSRLSLSLAESLPLQLASITMAGVVFSINTNWIDGGAWMVVTVIAALWRDRVRLQRERSAPIRWTRLASLLVLSAVWTIQPWVYWRTGDPQFQLLALVVFFGLLSVAQSFGFRSRQEAVAFALPPAVVLTDAMLTSGFASFKVVSLVFATLVAMLYLAAVVQQSFTNMRALRTSETRLREQTDAAVNANEAKSRFLAMTSHELRTPLNGVLGMAHALRQTHLDPSQQRQVQLLVQSGQGLLSILNDILDLSKIEAGGLELEQIPFDLRQIGADACALWRESASAEGLALTYDFRSQGSGWTVGDPTRLRQIINNLVANALKFTAEGEVNVRIDQQLDQTIVWVSDTGPGMSDDARQRLFQPFAQADASVARKYGGTGLGLSICLNLVQQMGGEITVQSRLGEGTTFAVALPLEPTAPHAAGAPAANAGPNTLGGLRVLVADDNPINLAVATALLEAFGVQVATAENGQEALERLGSLPCDLVLMDIHMPTMDGVEALRRIRRGEVGRPDVPVIALTADALPFSDARLQDAGFDAFVAKPIQPPDLLEKIALVCPAAFEPAAGPGDVVAPARVAGGRR